MNADARTREAAADYCPASATRAHYIQRHTVGGVPLAVRRCNFCGWINFPDLQAQLDVLLLQAALPSSTARAAAVVAGDTLPDDQPSQVSIDVDRATPAELRAEVARLDLWVRRVMQRYDATIAMQDTAAALARRDQIHREDDAHRRAVLELAGSVEQHLSVLIGIAKTGTEADWNVLVWAIRVAILIAGGCTCTPGRRDGMAAAYPEDLLCPLHRVTAHASDD